MDDGQQQHRDEGVDAGVDAPVDVAQLGWSAALPPQDFAARVAALHCATAMAGGDGAQGDVATSAKSRSYPWVAAALGLAAAVLLWLFTARPFAMTRDSLSASVVQSVAIKDRAIAVAQPGTQMRWSVEFDGTTRIEQDTGRVFYRVDKGGVFEVVTPTGRVVVTGTCFEVDVKTMAQGRAKSTVAGLMLGAATVVTVYEGRVVLANDSGEVEVAAGQGAQAHEGEVPQRWEHDELTTTGAGTGKADTDWQASVRQQAQTIERLREDNRAQYARVEALQRQVEALGGVVDDPHRGAKRVHEELERCARGSGSLGCSFLDSDQESLLAMAQCGTIKIDFPEFLQVGAVDDGGNMVRGFDGLTAQESAGFLAAARRYRQIHEDKLRQLYRELGGADEIAEQASGPVLTAHIEDLLGDDQNGDAIRRRIARERAGLEEPPEDLTALPVDERYERLRAGIGDAFEQEVARELGPQRARELRAEKDGWSGGRSVYSGECTE